MRFSYFSSMKLFIVLTVFCGGILWSCVSHDAPTVTYDCSGESEVSYSDDVDNLVKTRCAKSGCHNGDLGADKNWLVFETFQAKSALVHDRVTRRADEAGHMPADGTLTYDQILTIVCWVEQGAKNN
jgi:hypothetical protein